MSDATTNSIDGAAFAVALRSGIYRVVSQQELLNRINVFPVADSDTGTNLSLSLCAALPLLDDKDEQHLGRLLAALADAFLDSARGNSGAIIAQFFQGLSDSVGNAAEFTPESFAVAALSGAEYSRAALSQPRDGTVLTIINVFAATMQQHASDDNFPTQLRLAMAAVDTAVEDTPKQLDVLRKAGVVDAGAKGFAELLHGISDYLVKGEQTLQPTTNLFDEMPSATPLAAADNASQYRYCTECLVSAADIGRRKLREALNELGDSIVLAGTKRKAKIHIHTDNPDAVFELGRKFGSVSAEKADDMHRQHSATQDQSRSFAVITDSGADITDADLERLDIHMVPFRIQFGDRGFMDKVSISSDEFFAEFASNPNHPTTSQPAPGDFRRQFQYLASHFSDVISINLTSAASGAYEGARSAAERCDARGKIHVIDSRSASVGQGQLVVMAAECAAAGHRVEDTLRVLRQRIPDSRTYAVLEDLKYAVRGGRLPGWLKAVSNFLHVTPILTIKPNGRLGVGGSWFGRPDRAKRFAKFLARKHRRQASCQITVGHAACLTDATELVAELQARLPDARDISICDLGTAIGVHGGPGTLVVAIRPYDSLDIIADPGDRLD